MPQTILLVDDAEETRNFLADQILTPEGYRVLTASNGQDAYQLALANAPDLIIADYLMPQRTGLELLAALKEAGRNIPFILITAEGSESLAVRAMRLGVRDYLIKPFDIDDFLQAVQRVLNDRPQPNGNWLEGLLWQVPELIFVTDENNRLIYFNESAQNVLHLGNQYLHQPIQTVINLPEMSELFLNGQKSAQIELQDKRFWNAQLTVLPNRGKIVMMQDVSHFKELDRAKTEFVATISHDLRSPLTSILGYVELLGRIGTLNDQQKKFTANILTSVRSITNLLADLLELSKIETGLDRALEPTPMDRILQYALDTHLGEIETKQQRLITDIRTDLPPVLGHPIRLKQMISNLIQNAVKYTPEGGEIRLYLYSDGGFIIFQVQDNGIGIPLEEQPLIWNKFYRAREVIGEYQGTGLGLAIVKSIVDGHAGRIWLESIPNGGTTFTVMLPAHNPEGF